MCLPALALAATAVAAAGQGFSALQANSQAKYQARIAERNAGLENEAAEREQANTRDAALQHYRRVAALKGQQNVAAAANGVSLDFGSPAQVANDTDMLAREDVRRIYDQGFEKARGFEIGASNYRAEASAQRSAASGALVQGAFNIGSTVLGGAQQYGKIKANRAGFG